MDPTRWKLYLEAVRLWVPIIVSLCAITMTVSQAMATRRHQRLSVQPRLDWKVDVTRDGEATYALANVGFGPAVLKSLTLTVDGKPVGPDGPATCAAIDTALGRGAPGWLTSCFDMEDEYVIPAGNSVLIYASLKAPGSTATAPAMSPETYLRLAARGTYCSFYDDCWSLK